MKILHAAETIRGGVASVIRHNVKAQVNEFGSDNVHCLVPDEHARDLDESKPFSEHVFARNGRNIKGFLSFLKAFHSVMREVNPDIVHLHSTFAGVLGRICLIYLRIWSIKPKVIYCPHCWSFLMEGSNLKKQAYAMIERLLLPFVDRVICVSHFEKDEAEKLGVKSDKIIVIYNGVPIPDAPLKKESSDKTELLFVGRLDQQKGFDILLDVIKALDSTKFRLTVVGDKVNSEIEPPELDNVTYTGWVSASQIPNYFAKSDVLVMPSRWEGFAMCPLEAMSYETAVIASDITSIKEQIADGVGVLTPLEDVDRIVKVLQDTTKMEWETMGKAAREQVTARFSSDKMTEKTMALYKELI